jgi:hypothetical protein
MKARDPQSFYMDSPESEVGLQNTHNFSQKHLTSTDNVRPAERNDIVYDV